MCACRLDWCYEDAETDASNDFIKPTITTKMEDYLCEGVEGNRAKQEDWGCAEYAANCILRGIRIGSPRKLLLRPNFRTYIS